MKKSEVITNFLKANNIEIGSAEASNKNLFHSYNQAYPEYQCSAMYFKNIVTGVFVNNFNSSSDIVLERTYNAPELKTFVSEQIESLVPENFETKKVEEINFDSSILTPIKTGVSSLDEIMSYSGGIMPATIVMVPGESGVGKTTLLLQILGFVKRANPDKDVVFVSSEMNQIHIYKYKQRVKFDELQVCMLSESEHPFEELKNVLSKGWDIVLIDSLADTINKMRNQKGFSEKQAETEMLKLMDSVRRGNNDKNKFTTFLCTHHMTKGGTYTGSTNLKHMTDAMMNLLQCEENSDKAYVTFSKNRDGQKGIKLYYSINNEGVVFDYERFEADKLSRDKIKRAGEIINEKEKNFKSLFFGEGNVKPVDDLIVQVSASVMQANYKETFDDYEESYNEETSEF